MTDQTMDLAKIAHLARVGVSPEELDALSKNIDQTMTLIDRMQAIDTEQVQPLAHPLGIDLATRPDQAQNCAQSELQTCAPEDSIENDLYIVPQVIE